MITEYQKQFLLNHFFAGNLRHSGPNGTPGWLGIATTLIDEGKCVVAGTECIWIGGIGNFIKTKPIYFDCLEYNFDLDYFLTSSWFREIKSSYLVQLAKGQEEIKELLEEKTKEFSEMCDLLAEEDKNKSSLNKD